MKRPEAVLQRQVAGYLSWALPPDCWFTSIAHGSRGGGDAAWLRGAIWKGMGARSGVPDLLLVAQGRALFVELKAPKGRLSEAQMGCHAEIMAAGGQVAVCRSLDDLREALSTWGIPIREMRPSTERIVRGFNDARESPTMWPESDQLGRRRRKAP